MKTDGAGEIPGTGPFSRVLPAFIDSKTTEFNFIGSFEMLSYGSFLET